jgi:tRNA(Ile2) C34 agmatinyltransferase TiaS
MAASSSSLHSNARTFRCDECNHKFRSSAGRNATCPACGADVPEPEPPPVRAARAGSLSDSQIKWRARMQQRFRV